MALPPLVVALGCAWSVAASLLRDDGGLWPPDTVTLAEAAAIANGGEVERLIRAGGDPNRRTAVRPGLLADRALQVTPLEAAVWSRNEAMARQLVDLGVVLDGSTTRRVRCLHEVHPDAGLRAWLEQVSTAPWPTCGPGDTEGFR